MKKKIISITLIFIFVFSLGISTMAADTKATDSRTIKTSGGSAGYTYITFRCTCVQESIPTNYSWSSSISKPSNVSGLSYYQKGAITKQDQTQDHFSTSNATYSKLYVRNALVGGYAEMSAGSSVFGSARTTISVTR